MAGDEVGLGDQVAGADRLGAEAQVRDGDGAGLLRIVDEVALGEVVGILADDLDGVLVGAHGAVRAQAVEEARARCRGLRWRRSDPQSRLVWVTSSTMPTVKWFLGAGLHHFVEHGLDHGGGEFLGGEAVASADDVGHGRACPRSAFVQRGDDVEVERFADGAGFLGAVEDGDRLDGLGQGGDEVLDRRRAGRGGP